MTLDPDSDRNILNRARRLRREAPLPEALLWGQLRTKRLGAKFRRQQHIGGYFVDFYCHSAKLVVEIDGGQHFEPQNMRQDSERTAVLEAGGIRVLRFTNTQVLGQMDAVLDRIHSALVEAQGRNTPSP